MMHMRRYLLGSLLVMLLGLLALHGFCKQLPTLSAQPSKAYQHALRQNWAFYKKRHMVAGERVESNHYGGTISEGQSYALLKAVWMQDRKTFDAVWRWTKTHMKRPDDALLGWRWGKSEQGSVGLIEIENATDADQDIAYALLLAGEQWKTPRYTQDAQRIITDLWQKNVRLLHGRYYLLPGTWSAFQQGDLVTLDPSYFAPYVYRKFAQVDAAHADSWRQLARDIYPTLEACSNLTKTGLPPDWCGIRTDRDEIVFSFVQGPQASDFGYDAFRVFWRMGLDAHLGSAEAEAYLKRHRFLLEYWAQHPDRQTFPEGFTAEGAPRDPRSSGFGLSTIFLQAALENPGQRDTLYQTMLARDYDAEGAWFEPWNDYLQSVVWFNIYVASLR